MLVWAAEVFAKAALGSGVDEINHHSPTGEFERGLYRIGQPAADVTANYQPVNNHRNVVLKTLLQGLGFGQGYGLAVNHCSRIALSLQCCEEVNELALLLLHDWRQQLKAGALLELEQLVNNLLRGLLEHFFAADVAVRDSDSRPEQTKIVVNLGDGAHRRARVAVC